MLSPGSCCLFTILDLLNLGSINHWIYQCNVFQFLQSLNLESRSSHNISYFEVANPIRNPIISNKYILKNCQPHQNDQSWISLLNYTIFNLGCMFWLVVLTILKNISQWEGWHPILSHIIPYINIYYGTWKMFQTTNQLFMFIPLKKCPPSRLGQHRSPPQSAADGALWLLPRCWTTFVTHGRATNQAGHRNQKWHKNLSIFFPWRDKVTWLQPTYTTWVEAIWNIYQKHPETHCTIHTAGTPHILWSCKSVSASGWQQIAPQPGRVKRCFFVGMCPEN